METTAREDAPARLATADMSLYVRSLRCARTTKWINPRGCSATDVFFPSAASVDKMGQPRSRHA